MTRRIDTEARNESARLEEQAGDPAAVDAGYFNLYAKETGLYWIDDNEVVAGPLGSNVAPSGRLTLTSATPVTTADVTAATKVYYAPLNGNMISLYDGARWIPVTYTQPELDIAAYTASKPYDVFGYLSSNTLALEGLVWTDATTRATALAYQDGRLVKSGAATRLYLGTIYVNSSGGQTDDSITKRNVYNYYNRVYRRTYKAETTLHNYTTTSYRAWNNDATVRIEVTVGVVESPTLISLTTMAETCVISIAFDSTNAVCDVKCMLDVGSVSSIQAVGVVGAHYPTAPGWHYYQAIEFGTTGATESKVYISADVFA